MNDLIFEETRKVLLSKQKELKKKGKGNKLYAQKRPEKMNEDDSPFYLTVNNNFKKAESLKTKEWFKVSPVGINKLESHENYGSKSRN